jgi:hypothetical protein
MLQNVVAALKEGLENVCHKRPILPLPSAKG